LIEAAINELKTTPIAALGGVTSILAFLVLVATGNLSTGRQNNSDRAPSNTNVRVSVFGNSILWTASTACIAFLAFNLSFLLGVFLFFGAFGGALFVLSTQPKRLPEAEKEVGGFAVSCVVSGLFFGMFWQAVGGALSRLFTDDASLSFFAVPLAIVSIIATALGLFTMFAVGAPSVINALIEDSKNG